MRICPAAIATEAVLALLWLLQVRDRAAIARSLGVTLHELDSLEGPSPPPLVAEKVLDGIRHLVPAVEAISARLRITMVH